jgi:hypothetical protein
MVFTEVEYYMTLPSSWAPVVSTTSSSSKDEKSTPKPSATTSFSLRNENNIFSCLFLTIVWKILF